MKRQLKLLIGLVLLFSFTVNAANLAREQRIRDQIEDAILTGDPIDLTAENHTFLAIHTEADASNRKGAAIVLHGMGAHPNWVDVVQPLRTELPELGWETLSIQLPVAAAEASHDDSAALIPESFPRIDAAIAYLKQLGFEKIVLIAHSLGARMGVEYLAAKNPKDISAFVAVGVSAGKDMNQGTLAAIQKVQIPMLDIYGSQDLDNVIKSKKARKLAAGKAGNSDYRQVEVSGANHFFHGLDETLIKRVSAWLGKE